MPPLAPLSDSDSDSDIPEVVPRSTARAQVQDKRAALQFFHAEQKSLAKTRNRARDAREKDKAKGRLDTTENLLRLDDGEGSRAPENRMRQAMADADDEGSSMDEALMESADDAELETNSAADDSEHDESEEPNFITGKAGDVNNAALSTNPNYLPEHLFAALGRRPHEPSPSSPRNLQSKAKTQTITHKLRRSRRKDVIVGGRTVRALNAAKPLHPQTLPPARVEKFKRRVLALSKTSVSSSSTSSRLPGKKPQKQWERRPAHLGAFRTSSGLVPLSCFARKD